MRNDDAFAFELMIKVKKEHTHTNKKDFNSFQLYYL